MPSRPSVTPLRWTPAGKPRASPFAWVKARQEEGCVVAHHTQAIPLHYTFSRESTGSSRVSLLAVCFVALCRKEVCAGVRAHARVSRQRARVFFKQAIVSSKYSRTESENRPVWVQPPSGVEYICLMVPRPTRAYPSTPPHSSTVTLRRRIGLFRVPRKLLAFFCFCTVVNEVMR